MVSTPTSARFCDRLGITHPIVLAPMGGGPATPELIAAVADRGGLGSIAAGYLSPDALGDALDAVRALTSGAISINIFVPPAEPIRTDLTPAAAAVLDELAAGIGAEPRAEHAADPTTFARQVDLAVGCDAAMVSFTFGLPSEETIARLHRTGKVVAATANTLAEAEQVAEAGCDAVILQGFEAGAHRGGLAPRGDRHVGLFALLELARARLDIDVIASGGITSGAGVAAALALGASAAQLGTAFLVTDESGATPEWKKAAATSADVESVVTPALTGKGARGVRNPFIERMEELGDDLPDYPALNTYTTALRARAKQLGDPDYQSLWAGQAGSAADGGPADAMMDRLVAEADRTVGDLAT